MGKFRVEVTESIRYFVDLEAEDEDQAREKAEEFVISNAERDKLNLEVYDRDTGNCFENPPNWESDIPPVTERDGWQVRHDLGGWYLCTDEEAEIEDGGQPSAGFDGREHYPSLELASAALVERTE